VTTVTTICSIEIHAHAAGAGNIQTAGDDLRAAESMAHIHRRELVREYYRSLAHVKTECLVIGGQSL
jgi:hypothetical protein